jgi:hypothetical protein
MDIYNYSKITGEYLSTEPARESPLEPGVFLIPAYATALPLPIYNVNEIPVFREDAWEVTIDFRGTYYDSNRRPVVVTELGVHVPAGCTTEPAPYTPEELAAIAAKEARIAELTALMDAATFHKYTPQQLNTYINNSFDESADLAQVKTALKKLFKEVLIYLLKP